MDCALARIVHLRFIRYNSSSSSIGVTIIIGIILLLIVLLLYLVVYFLFITPATSNLMAGLKQTRQQRYALKQVDQAGLL